MTAVLRRTVALALLSLALFGCSVTSRWEMMPRHLGVRPDEPAPVAGELACAEHLTFVKYAQELQEAYHSRATQNRWWIYGAGTTALGTIAASASLAAASAASSGTLALLPIAGGFAAGFFGLLDNGTLADLYTIAANRVATAMQESDAMLQVQDGSRYQNQNACASALVHLRDGVIQARNNLERARTDSAVAAIERAQAQTEKLKKLAEQVPEPTRVTLKGQITDITPNPLTSGKQELVTLTVAHVDFGSLRFDSVRVLLGGERLSVRYWVPPESEGGSYSVFFTAPSKPPDANKHEYELTLVVGDAGKRIESKPGLVLKYQ